MLLKAYLHTKFLQQFLCLHVQCMWQFFSLVNCHCFEPAGNLIWYISSFLRFTANNYVLTFSPTPPPFLSSLSHNENKYYKRKSFVNLCTVLTERMHITNWSTCSTVTMFSARLSEKILGPAGPQVFIFGRQNKYSGCQKLYLGTNGPSITSNLIKRVLTIYMYCMKLTQSTAFQQKHVDL